MLIKGLKIGILCCALVALSACKNGSDKSKKAETTLHIATTDDPGTMDPRLARNLYSAQFMHILYEGLMRTDENGQPQLAAAESVEASLDLMTYTFTLRPSKWSNGEPVTSSDFAYSLKTSLDPSFPAPNAYQLFDIVGARGAKEGKQSIGKVGIETPDERTLIIHLENPNPYFLDLVTFHGFFPVYQKNDVTNPTWPDGPAEVVITNGPFKLKEWKHNQYAIAEKNPNYWDVGKVKLGELKFSMIEGATALQLFEQNKLDWIGSPLSTIPTDTIPGLRAENRLSTSPAAATYWFRVNVTAQPLTSIKLRQALSYAIDRKNIVQHIAQGNQIPATGIIPPSFMSYHEPYFKDHDSVEARRLFQEAITELNLSIDNFPTITISYGPDDVLHKIAQAIQQEWSSLFPVPQGTFQLHRLESKVLSQNVSNGGYQLAIGSWFADFKDPVNFLDVFKFAANGTNNTHWENQNYITLLDQASIERDPIKRRDLLERAEKLLISEMPVIPLFHASYNYAKTPKLRGAYLSDLGYIEFKNAYIGSKSSEIDETPN